MREGSEKTLKTGVIGRPKTVDERVILATECVTEYKFTLPMVIDGIDQKVAMAYDARTVRTTITDKDGKVAYYAGRGPFGFSIPEIERALKKIAAHNGYLPPPPPTQWGAPVKGLRYGIAIDPPEVKVGDDVLVMIKFENTTDKPINLLYQSADAARNLVIKNSKDQALTVQAGGGGPSQMMMGRSRRPRPQQIAPGRMYETQIEGRIVAADEAQTISSGNYTAVSRFAVTEETIAQLLQAPAQPLWTGQVSSGACLLDVAIARQETCADCHGGADYHHSDFQSENCENCHAGRVGTEDFVVKKDNCGPCHPRHKEEAYGRREVLGPAGEFSKVSRHIAGAIKDENCLRCHDLSQHLKGVVRLVNHNDGGKAVAADGGNTAFCLGCHDGSPPAEVIFPKAKGSGYDKSSFTMMGQGGQAGGCSACHHTHGSTLPSLLKDIHRR